MSPIDYREKVTRKTTPRRGDGTGGRAGTVTQQSLESAHGCAPPKPALASHVRSLWWVLLITSVFLVAEVIGGILANSLALLADAGHMLTDVGAVGLAIFVAWVAQRPATPEKTYGYLRLEILAALVNGSALFIIAGSIVWEAVRRISAPPEVEPRILFAVAAVGLVANLVAMRILHSGHAHSLNIRAAYLHVMSDLLGSVGALLAGGLIFVTGWTLADPIVSVGVALLILASAWRLVRESVEVLLEATPSHISLQEVEQQLRTIPSVSGVHDLHVWTVTSGVVAMSGHVMVEEPAENQRVLEEAQRRLAGMNINHVTVQIEQNSTCE
jgi:cobalt-zinc-cadmium efflux system protein